MSGVDTTGQYRHGVLIGNWNEDHSGTQLSANLGVQANETTYQSVNKASYRPGGEAAAKAYYETKTTRKNNDGVSADLLFSHIGASEKTRWNTTYNIANSDLNFDPAAVSSGRTALMDKKKKEWARDAGNTRNLDYNTENTNQFHNGNSARSQPADNTFIRKGALESTFDSPFRRMRLRCE